MTLRIALPYCGNLGKRRLRRVGRQAGFASWVVDSETGLVSSNAKKSPRFQTVIGLEIHAQLKIATKLFSGCPRPTSLFAKPNSHVWPFDIGVPGVLPRLSQDAVQAAVLSAAALNCHIPKISRFERKHYFYADLPLGYQVTQQRWPLAMEGTMTCHKQQPKGKKKKKRKQTKAENGGNDETFSARIERIQLEQDTGKTILMPQTKDSSITNSLVDFNRAGCALIEIVFHPDLRSSTQAAIAVETLRNLLRHIGTCDGKMEEGSLRCDLNVSVAPLPDEDDSDSLKDSTSIDLLKSTGNRVEVKNLNSIRQVQQAAEYEAKRQVEAIMEGNPTGQETRTYDVKSGKTVVIRSKEGAKDYRFMPEPDLPPIVLDKDAFGGIDLAEFLEKRLPELPEDARERLQVDYGISEYVANVLTGDPPAIEMFDEAVVEATRQLDNALWKTVPDAVANLLCNELFALVREYETSNAAIHDESGGGEASIKHSKVSSKQLGGVVALFVEGTISNTMAKKLLAILYTEEGMSEGDPRTVAQQRGFQLITDSEELAQLCRAVIEENPDEMEKYRMGGKFARKIQKFLLGQCMQKSNMNAHPERLNEILGVVLAEVEPTVGN